MAVYLVRHAETVFNAARIVQPPETPLSARGVVQARRLADRLATAGIAAIRSSDLVRAVATAEGLCAATGAPLVLDPDLQERDYGAIRGRPYAELREDIFAPDYVPPDGESWDAFHGRIDRAWRRVTDAAVVTRGHLVVVTHGLVCFSILSRHLVPPPGIVPSLKWGNTSVTIVDGPEPWRVRLLDCSAHLDVESDPGGPAA